MQEVGLVKMCNWRTNFWYLCSQFQLFCSTVSIKLQWVSLYLLELVPGPAVLHIGRVCCHPSSVCIAEHHRRWGRENYMFIAKLCLRIALGCCQDGHQDIGLRSSPGLGNVCMSAKTTFGKALVCKSKGIWPDRTLTLPKFMPTRILYVINAGQAGNFFSASLPPIWKILFQWISQKGLKKGDWLPTNQLDLKRKLFCSLLFFKKSK